MSRQLVYERAKHILGLEELKNYSLKELKNYPLDKMSSPHMEALKKDASHAHENNNLSDYNYYMDLQKEEEKKIENDKPLMKYLIDLHIYKHEHKAWEKKRKTWYVRIFCCCCYYLFEPKRPPMPKDIREELERMKEMERLARLEHMEIMKRIEHIKYMKDMKRTKHIK